jgi:hypothetical protein
MNKRQQRRLARRVAISSWAKGNRTPEALEAAFKADERICSLDPATIMLLIKIALMLWSWWKEKNIDTPTEKPSPGEPDSE